MLPSFAGRTTSFIFIILTGLISLDAIAQHIIPPSHPLLVLEGRWDTSEPNQYKCSYPGSALTFKTNSPFVILKWGNIGIMQDINGIPFRNFYQILVDGKEKDVISIGDGENRHRIYIGGGEHVVTVFKRTESSVGMGTFEGLELEKGKNLLIFEQTNALAIEFIGNSITCGYGNEGTSAECPFTPDTENNYLAYGAILARKLQASYRAVAYSGKGICQNYDTTDKNTLPLLYKNTLPFESSPVYQPGTWNPSLVVINLGTNDFAHKVPNEANFVNAYVEFLFELRRMYPKAKILCIEGPMTTDYWPVGGKHLTKVKQFIKKAVESSGLKNVKVYFPSSQSKEDFGCDYHPNTVRHEKMANELLPVIQGFLKE